MTTHSKILHRQSIESHPQTTVTAWNSIYPRQAEEVPRALDRTKETRRTNSWWSARKHRKWEGNKKKRKTKQENQLSKHWYVHTSTKKTWNLVQRLIYILSWWFFMRFPLLRRVLFLEWHVMFLRCASPRVNRPPVTHPDDSHICLRVQLLRPQ